MTFLKKGFCIHFITQLSDIVKTISRGSYTDIDTDRYTDIDISRETHRSNCFVMAICHGDIEPSVNIPAEFDAGGSIIAVGLPLV